MTKPFETITLPLLNHVTGGAFTAAATSSQSLPPQMQSSLQNGGGGPGSGGYMSRTSVNGGNARPQ